MVKQPSWIPSSSCCDRWSRYHSAYRCLPNRKNGKKITFLIHQDTRPYACAWCICYRYYYLGCSGRTTGLCLRPIERTFQLGVEILEFAEISATTKISKNCWKQSPLKSKNSKQTRGAIGTVIEARLIKEKGAVATLRPRPNASRKITRSSKDQWSYVCCRRPINAGFITGLNEIMVGDHFAVTKMKICAWRTCKTPLMKQRRYSNVPWKPSLIRLKLVS